MTSSRAATSSAKLLARWRAGDEQAAGDLWRRYAERLVSLARTRLSKALVRVLDPEDVVQSAYRCFFVNARSDRYVLRHSGDLWRLLVAITLHKLHKQFRRHTTRKRTVNRQEYLDDLSSSLDVQAQLLTREPSPDEAAVIADEVALLLERLRQPVRHMVELCLQGESVEEIAKATQRHVVTVRRNLKGVTQYLRRRCVESVEHD